MSFDIKRKHTERQIKKIQKELKSFKERELAVKRMRGLARTKRKAKVVGTLKYGKTTALIKGGKTLAARSKRIRAERKKVASATPKKKDGYFSGEEWRKRLRKTYGWK